MEADRTQTENFMGKSSMSIFETTILETSGVSETSDVGAAVKARTNIFDMTQLAETALLRPLEHGMFPHDFRAALASRIALHAGETDLAQRYAMEAGDKLNFIDSTKIQREPNSTLIAFVDKAANATKDIVAQDISELQSVGILDADIVRLCELIAFVAYQLRVVSGLRLMNGRA
jgi:uncharacterized protein YciW